MDCEIELFELINYWISYHNRKRGHGKRQRRTGFVICRKKIVDFELLMSQYLTSGQIQWPISQTNVWHHPMCRFETATTAKTCQKRWHLSYYGLRAGDNIEKEWFWHEKQFFFKKFISKMHLLLTLLRLLAWLLFVQ